MYDPKRADPLRLPLVLVLTLGVASCAEASSSPAQGALDASSPADAAKDVRSSHDAADAEVTLDVSALPGVVLWLDASKGVIIGSGGGDAGDGVTAWLDSSRIGNNLSDALATCRLYGGAVNGHAGIACGVPSGLRGVLQASVTQGLDWGNGTFYVAAVMSSTPNANIAIDWNDGTGEFIMGIGSSRGWVAARALGSSTDRHVYGTTELTNAHLIAGMRLGSSLILRVDGVVDAQTTGLDSALTLAGKQVGLAGQSPQTSMVAEIVVIAGEPSASVLSTLEGYLMARYGI